MKKVINTNSAPLPIGPYSQAVNMGGLLFISGQIALDPVNGHLHIDDIRTETLQVMENIKAILTAAAIDFSAIVKTSIFLTDMDNFADVNEVYGTYFKNEYPARETVQVSALPKGVNVEISAIANL